MKNRLALFAIAILCELASISAAATITVGNWQLRPNEPNQWIDIGVTGGDRVSGVDLFLQLGDGGPQLADFGLLAGIAGPAITEVDLKFGTIFQNVSDVPTNVGSSRLRQTAVYTVALVGSTPTVVAEGVLARVQIDTTGFFGGAWSLRLDNVLPFDIFGGPHWTNFAGQSAAIRNGTVTIPIARGDYNGNHRFDAPDVDALAAAIRAGSSDRAQYDLNGDNVVNRSDQANWVHSFARTYFGDANRDGQFGTSDLVQVFVSSTYEDAVFGNANWSSGDWDGDSDFTTSDLVIAFQDGGYESGPRVAVVPEPASWTWLILSVLSLGRRSPNG